MDAALGVSVAGTALGKSCGNLTLSPDGQKLYVLHPKLHSVSVLDAHSLLPIDEPFHLDVRPTELTLDHSGRRLFVSCDDDGELYVFDTDSGQRLPCEGAAEMIQPGKVTMSPDGRSVYVPLRTPEPHPSFIVLDARDLSVTKPAPKLGRGCSGVVPVGTKLYALLDSGHGVCVLDAETLEPMAKLLPKQATRFQASGWAITRDGRYLCLLDLYASHTVRRELGAASGVYIVDTRDDSYHCVALPLQLSLCAVSRDDRRLYVYGTDILARHRTSDLKCAMLSLGCSSIRDLDVSDVVDSHCSAWSHRLVEVNLEHRKIRRTIRVGVAIDGLVCSR